MLITLLWAVESRPDCQLPHLSPCLPPTPDTWQSQHLPPEALLCHTVATVTLNGVTQLDQASPLFQALRSFPSLRLKSGLLVDAPRPPATPFAAFPSPHIAACWNPSQCPRWPWPPASPSPRTCPASCRRCPPSPLPVSQLLTSSGRPPLTLPTTALLPFCPLGALRLSASLPSSAPDLMASSLGGEGLQHSAFSTKVC